MIAMSERYLRSMDVSERRVGDTTYLIDARHNAIHQLDPIGAAIWRQLAGGESLENLIGILHEAYASIDRDVIERDVTDLIGDLLDMGLVERMP